MKRIKKRRRRGALFFLLLALALAFLVYDSNTRVVTDEYNVQSSRLPASFDGYRIAQLSDVHAAVFGDGNANLLAAVKGAKPNIIVITGDLIDSDNELNTVDPLVKGLLAIAPVYYVTGNHEWDCGGLKPLLALLDKDGVTVLRNTYVKLTVGQESIVLAGIDDPNGPKDMKTPKELIAEIRQKEGDPYIILLGHRNNKLDLFASLSVDLVFCGHAHGGIVRLPFVGGIIGPNRDWFPDYTSGLYEKGTTQMLVSRGIGNHTGFPRFLNNPEVLVAVLRTA